MPIDGLTSASEPKHTQEPKCHSMDLHQLPSTQQHNKLIGSRGLEPITVKHTLKQTDNKLLRSQALEPNNCQTTHKKKKGENEKGRPERSAHLLPTYLIWFENQGDVVPLVGEKGLA